MDTKNTDAMGTSARKNKYIVFEGVDGSGKTTLMRAVNAALEARGDKTLAMAFPSHNGAAGKLIRQVFADPQMLDHKAMMFLFIADAVDQEPVVRAAYERGEHVLLDRHTQYSAQVYQSEIHGLAMVDAVTPHAYFQTPDAVFVVDVSPEVAINRMMDRAKATGAARNTLYEKYDHAYLERQRHTYLNVVAAEEEIVHVLDGTHTIEANTEKVLRWMAAPADGV